MAFQLIYGNSGSGKSTYIYEKVIQMAQADRRRNFYVIVPEQFTMQAQRELVRRSQNHVIVNIDVVSFERLAYRIFDELGIQNTVMEETGKSLVLRKIAEEKNGGKPIKVVANLPYYITTPIIMGLFEKHVPIESITVMVQKEVADRMQVGPGSKDYGALSLAVQYYAEPYIVANVPPNCFMPRPKVGSAVIRLTRHEVMPVETKDEKLMFSIIRASFNQRRKTLANGLKNSELLHFSKEEIEAAITACGWPLTIRGEALNLQEFARLTDELCE